MTRSVEDAMLVLRVISGPDAGMSRAFPRARFRCERIRQGPPRGYIPKWMKESPATEVDRNALEAVKKLA